MIMKSIDLKNTSKLVITLLYSRKYYSLPSARYVWLVNLYNSKSHVEINKLTLKLEQSLFW